jgi:hypothetical protein
MYQQKYPHTARWSSIAYPDARLSKKVPQKTPTLEFCCAHFSPKNEFTK